MMIIGITHVEATMLIELIDDYLNWHLAEGEGSEEPVLIRVQNLIRAAFAAQVQAFIHWRQTGLSVEQASIRAYGVEHRPGRAFKRADFWIKPRTEAQRKQLDEAFAALEAGWPPTLQDGPPQTQPETSPIEPRGSTE